MARNHARILTDIWNDEDFLALPSGAQRLYLMLLSQQNLSHAGLLPLTVKRWANKAPDLTVEQVESYLDLLISARFILVDYDTEELLIRSFIRRDEVYKQPNVMAAAATDARAIASHALQQALAVEIDRIRRIEGLSERVSVTLRSLGEALPNPSANPSLGDTREPRGWGVVTDVSSASPAPSPSPSPVPALRAEPPDDPTGDLLIEHANAYGEIPPPSALAPVRVQIARLVAENVAPDRIRAGLTRLREKSLAASLLPQLVTEAQTSSGRAPPSRNDQILDRAMQRAEAAEAHQARKALP